MHEPHGRHGPRRGMMMHCGPHGSGMMHGHDPSMCCRSFFTKEEKSELLEKYREWLEKEAKGVEEHLEMLGGE